VPEHVIGVLSDLLRYRMLVSEEEVTDEMIEELVDDVFLPLIRAHAAKGSKGSCARCQWAAPGIVERT
jgi:bacterioferritin-associated ferredoxin